MSGLVLVAAGGLAREVLAVEAALGRFREILLVDDDSSLWGREIGGRPVVGGLDLVEDLDHQVLVCAGRGGARRAIVERLSAAGVPAGRFTRSVHPSVGIPRGCTVGAGSILLAGAVLTAHVRVGEHVVVMPNVTLTHDDVVGDYATLCGGVTLGGHVRVAEEAYLGMGSCVRERLVVGRRSVLGMGSVLLADLPDDEVWYGVPARPGVRAAVGV